MTAEAEKTMASPITTNRKSVKKSHLSTPTRFAMRAYLAPFCADVFEDQFFEDRRGARSFRN